MSINYGLSKKIFHLTGSAYFHALNGIINITYPQYKSFSGFACRCSNYYNYYNPLRVAIHHIILWAKSCVIYQLIYYFCSPTKKRRLWQQPLIKSSNFQIRSFHAGIKIRWHISRQ